MTEIATIMFIGGGPGTATSGLVTGSGIESRLAIVPMITTGLGTIRDGMTGATIGVGNLLRKI